MTGVQRHNNRNQIHAPGTPEILSQLLSLLEYFIAAERDIDVRPNCQEDSLLLWKMINASKLLSKTELVLFLNKCDILTAKLEAGTRFKDYVQVYDGTNTMEGVTRCEPFALVVDCIARDGNDVD